MFGFGNKFLQEFWHRSVSRRTYDRTICSIYPAVVFFYEKGTDFTLQEFNQQRRTLFSGRRTYSLPSSRTSSKPCFCSFQTPCCSFGRLYAWFSWQLALICNKLGLFDRTRALLRSKRRFCSGQSN